MFVAAGAKLTIQKKRRKEFSEKYIKKLLSEAESIGITKDELISMIREEA